jgi:hypothetical protein
MKAFSISLYERETNHYLINIVHLKKGKPWAKPPREFEGRQPLIINLPPPL